jgi:hypothetical protein
MKFRSFLISSIAAFGFLLAACGSGSGGGNQPISVAISNPPSSVAVSSTAAIMATVANDSKAAGVAWTVTCNSSSCGSVSPSSSTGNSPGTTFTAPTGVPSGNTVTITASSLTDSTKAASVSITITASASVSVSLSSPPKSVVISSVSTLTAVVSEDSKAAGVTWSVSCASAGACGSFNPTTSPGNTATTTYTAPAAVPSESTVTVKATSVTDTTKSASATITIAAAPPAVLADGNYVYRATGEDANGVYFVAGVFTVAKGAITAGEQDFLDPANGQTDSLVASDSSVSLASNGNFQLVLATGDSNVGVNGVETFRGTLVSSTHAQISEFDPFAAAGGTLDLQTGIAAPSGGYAFNLQGIDGSTRENPLFIGGILNIQGTLLSTANSVFDYFDDGTIGHDQSFTSGTVSAPDSFGRVTINLTPTQSSGAVEFGVAGYIVGTSRIQFVELPNDTLQGTLGGTALGQGANTGNFSAATVSGSSYAFIAVGEDAPNGTATFAGGFALNSNGTVSGNLAYADTGSDQGLTIAGGNWTIDARGRVAITNLTTSASNIGNGPFTFEVYVDGNGNALVLGNDAIQGSTGPSFAQTGDLTPGNYCIGAEGFAGTANLPVWAAVGPVSIDNNLNWTGFTDYNVFSGVPESSVALRGTTDTSSGLFSITGLNAVSPTPAMPEFGYYPIDSTKVLAIEVDNNQLGLFIIEAITQ